MPLLVEADGVSQEPVAVFLEREGQASESEVRRRQAAAADDLCCFVTLLGLQDEDEEAVLGLGLHAHSRSAQQQRLGLPPDFDLVFDYLDVEAFNQGVLRAADRADRQREVLPAMVSSARKQLNGWLPAYINATHWARARPYAASAFAMLAVGKPASAFRPRHALDVCCSLLTCAVAGFTVGQSGCASPRTAGRGKASERAVQMYADVHRLLLQMAREYPEVRRLALQRLENFISDPAARTRSSTPSLGNLIHCLLLVEQISWEDLAPVLIPEAMRRHVLRQERKGYAFEPGPGSCSEEKLIAAWDSFAPQAGVVSCFSVMFHQRVGRPSNCVLRDVEEAYDRSWGRLASEVIAEVLAKCSNICQQTSIRGVLELLLPEALKVEDLEACSAELALWAARHGRYWEHEQTTPIPAEEWPSLSGPYTLLEGFRAAGRSRPPCQWRARWPQRDAQRQRQLQWQPVEQHGRGQQVPSGPPPSPAARAPTWHELEAHAYSAYHAYTSYWSSYHAYHSSFGYPGYSGR